MPHTVILMVGRDRLLMKMRSQVLRGAGYTVEPSCSPLQAIDKFVTGDFDLVLLCHSIPAGDRERVARPYSRTHVAHPGSFRGVSSMVNMIRLQTQRLRTILMS
jgi:CheY-like chemotaxis protein